jgi:hypothetical protein
MRVSALDSLEMSTAVATEKIWRLLAISLDPDQADPAFYGLVLEGDIDEPLMHEGRVVLFREAARAADLLARYGSSMKADRAEISKPFFWCDVAQTLHLLQAGGLDEDACVLGAVNALLDLVRATGLKMPASAKAALHSIADYCTMNKDLTKYLEEEGDYSSDALVDAVLWCVGAVATKSTVL